MARAMAVRTRDVAQDGVAGIEDDVVEDGAGAVFDSEMRIAAQGVDFVGGEGVAFDVGGTFFEFEGAGGGVGDDGEADAGDVGIVAPVGRSAGDDDVAVELLADEREGSAADGMLAEVATAAVGDDADGAVAEIEGERGVGLFEMEDDGGGVGGVDVVEGGEGAGLHAR